MPTEALRTFERNRRRIENLLSFYDFVTNASRGKPSKDCSELGRGAWAETVSCFEAYLHDVLAERLGKTISRGQKEWTGQLLERVKKVASPETVLSLAASKAPHEMLASALAGSYDRLSIQSEDRVTEVLQILGARSPWDSIAIHFEPRGRGGAKTPDQIREGFRGIVDHRNLIVHRADIPKPGAEAKTMRKADAEWALGFVTNLAVAIDEALRAQPAEAAAQTP
jgi:hypothetical protein